MKKFKLKLSKLFLSIYSFGYSAGFISDNRVGAKSYQKLTLRDLAYLTKKLGLGGIEFPVDKYFKDPIMDGLKEFIEEMDSLGLKLVFDLENFSSQYLKKIQPILISYGAKFVRVKVSNFYGGNRYKNFNYLDDLKTFEIHLAESLPLLKESGLRLLIENHQDIVAEDLLNLINKYGHQYVGVNWDIGNSLPTGETPSTFFDKLGSYIGNIHLKDYKLYPSEKGYIMTRCQIGEGFVDFKEILNSLNNKFPMTIELGALNSREADINIPEYWDHTLGINQIQKAHFINFINQNLISNSDWRTPWELGSSPKNLAKLELKEIINSVNYLKSL